MWMDEAIVLLDLAFKVMDRIEERKKAGGDVPDQLKAAYDRLAKKRAALDELDGPTVTPTVGGPTPPPPPPGDEN